MILFLDTTTDDYCIALCSDTGQFLLRKVLQRAERIGDKVFRATRNFLKKKKPTRIIVVVGPGRFSGIRHSLSIANTLAFAWSIPLIGVEKRSDEDMRHLLKRALRQKPSSFLLPHYGQEPTITL